MYWWARHYNSDLLCTNRHVFTCAPGDVAMSFFRYAPSQFSQHTPPEHTPQSTNRHACIDMRTWGRGWRCPSSDTPRRSSRRGTGAPLGGSRASGLHRRGGIHLLRYYRAKEEYIDLYNSRQRRDTLT
jgi:hypothetical protein